MSDELRDALEDVVAAAEAAAERERWVEAQRAYMEQIRTACGCHNHVGGLFLEQVAKVAHYYVPETGETEEEAEAFLNLCLEAGSLLAAND